VTCDVSSICLDSLRRNWFEGQIASFKGVAISDKPHPMQMVFF
jgi:hypothetical protein